MNRLDRSPGFDLPLRELLLVAHVEEEDPLAAIEARQERLYFQRRDASWFGCVGHYGLRSSCPLR